MGLCAGHGVANRGATVWGYVNGPHTVRVRVDHPATLHWSLNHRGHRSMAQEKTMITFANAPLLTEYLRRARPVPTYAAMVFLPGDTAPTTVEIAKSERSPVAAPLAYGCMAGF